jgi:hypothetical protein
MEGNMIPQGKVEFQAKNDGASYTRWAPGTGFVFQAIISELPEGSGDYVGGERLISLDCFRGWVSVALSNELIFFFEGFVAEHFNRAGNMNEQDIVLYTAMLNWILGNEQARNYADGLWDRAGIIRRVK